MAVIGGGSSYTPEIIEGVAAADLPCRELRLFDINAERLDVMAALARRMLARVGSPIRLVSTTDRAAALAGADFVIAQIRVGGMAARHLDESIPLEFDVIGQETVGPGGMFKALRTIPAMLDLAHEIERLAPQAWLLNMTNPSGIVTEALLRHSKVRTLGLCSSPALYLEEIRRRLGRRAIPTWAGMNHMAFVTWLEWQGGDLLDEFIASEEPGDWRDLQRALHALPLRYLRYYYFQRECVAEAKAKGKTRAQEIMEVERDVFEQARDPLLDAKPEALARRGGAGYAAVALAVIEAVLNDTGEDQIVSARNSGALTALPDDCVIEARSALGAQGAWPHPIGEIPPAIRGLLQAMKAYELLTVEAAVTGSRQAAVQAMLANPLVPGYSEAVGLVDRLLAAHRQYLPQ
jgi:6-phospho-beta-glucosidase